jgi:hypothetical protein
LSPEDLCNRPFQEVNYDLRERLEKALTSNKESSNKETSNEESTGKVCVVVVELVGLCLVAGYQ